ncbi:hypothetical protein PSAC2689_140004 [Paraburkholderia sacchari]
MLARLFTVIGYPVVSGMHSPVHSKKN